MPAVNAMIQSRIVNATQRWLDEFSITKFYDAIRSAWTYKESSQPPFAAKGKYAILTRDTTRAALYALLSWPTITTT